MEVGIRQLPVKIAHTTALHTLALHHNDPFDRMLIAQAIAEGLRSPVPTNISQCTKACG